MTGLAQIQPLRLFVALLVAAISSSFFLVVATFHSNVTPKQALLVPSVTLGSSWVLFLIGTLSLTAWRRNIRRIDCDLLGAAVAFILPLASLLLAMRGLPLIMPDSAHGGAKMPVGSALSFGLWQQPFGWFAGRMIWCIGFPNLAEHHVTETTRAWSDLNRRRLLLILCLVPVLPAVAILIGLLWGPTHGFSQPTQADVWTGLIILTVASSLVLATVGGSAFLYACSRNRHRAVSRANCLTLGAAIALLLPCAASVVGFGLGMLLPVVHGIEGELFALQTTSENVAFLLLFGATITPLGVPSGWLLWKIGVAPAPAIAYSEDPAHIFD